MRSLELRIPPPAIALLAAAGMWLIATAGPAAVEPPQRWRFVATIVVAAIALAIMAAGAIAFWRARTTVNPMRPDRASALVTDGIYRRTRNPMYLADLMLLLAWALVLASPWTLAGPLVFVVYINRFQIAAEERMLGERFGAEFAAYKARVRRWI